MKPKHVLIFGSIIAIILILLWYFEIIEEPIAALGGAGLTLIGYILSNGASKSGKGQGGGNKPTKINQSHSGTGDNVGGDKIVNN